LKPGAFDAQNIITILTAKLIRRIGALPDDQMTQVESVVKLWLGFEAAP
jgi:mRNA-degrading endonuclease toxin of MazEF toxin-antitoxin module